VAENSTLTAQPQKVPDKAEEKEKALELAYQCVNEHD